MSRSIRVASVSDVPPGSSKEVIAEDRVVALFNVAGEFHALDGVCPHAGGPLGEGALSGTTVTCPWHGWQFDVRTGKHGVAKSVVQPRFPVRIDQDVVWVELPESS